MSVSVGSPNIFNLAATHLRPPRRRFPKPVTPGRIARSVAMTLASVAAAIGCSLVLASRMDWWQGYVAATVVSVLAGATSVVPLSLGIRRRTIEGAVVGYLVSSGVRAGISLGGCLFAIHAGHYPSVPTLLLMMAFYMANLIVESILMCQATAAVGVASKTP